MSTSSTRQKIMALIADVCAVDAGSIREEGKLLGYGLDSVRVIDLLLAIEEELGVTIDESDPALSGVETVGELIDFVERRRPG